MPKPTVMIREFWHSFRGLRHFDAGGRARAMAGIVEAMAMAKEADVDPTEAARLVNFDG